MTKQGGLGDRLLIDGYNLSGDIGSLGRIGGGPAAGEVTAIDKSAIERLGLVRTGGIDFTSWFNPTANQEHDVLSTLPTTDRHAMYLRGMGIGNAGAGLIGKQINYDPERGADGSLALGITIESNSYGIEWGEQLTAGLRTDTVATSPATGLDGLASSTFGGQAYLQVLGVTGTSVTARVQDSADNASFANIAGGGLFVAATAVGAQRIELTGTIRRYLRVITTGTFSSAQFAVLFVRNASTVVF